MLEININDEGNITNLIVDDETEELELVVEDGYEVIELKVQEVGRQGFSAFELAQIYGGFIGTMEDWFDTFEAGPQGEQGPKGDTGEAGPKGDQGDVGPKGDQGDQGPRGLIGLTGGIGPEGPQGEQGIAGPKGDTGDQGPQGLIGLTGGIGPDGPRGIQGEQGPKGDQGTAGLKGDTGDQGPRGLTGLTGEQGEQGPKGDTGDTGPTGQQGDIGPEGPQGIQGEQGEKGDTGLKGDTGDTGLTGQKGDTGDQGGQGPIGEQGPKGDKGEKGDTGDQGPKGDDGEKGDTGDQGPQGIPGASGALTPAESDKLNSIAFGATANQTDAHLLARANHTGVQAISTVTNLQSTLDAKLSTLAGHGLYPDVDKTKLSGVAVGATANQTDANLLNRSNHTGVQLIATITGLQTALDAAATTAYVNEVKPSNQKLVSQNFTNSAATYTVNNAYSETQINTSRAAFTVNLYTPPAGANQPVIYVTIGNASAKTITWSSNSKWSTGTAPTFESGRKYRIGFIWDYVSQKWIGSVVTSEVV